jgi:hypothetical protein
MASRRTSSPYGQAGPRFLIRLVRAPGARRHRVVVHANHTTQASPTNERVARTPDVGLKVRGQPYIGVRRGAAQFG